MSQPLRDLKLRLKQLRVQNADRRWFIPGLCLHEVLTKATIRQTLLAAKIKSHLVDEVVKHVLEHGVRIFGVLVMIEQVTATVKFMEAGELIDHRLPFDRSTLDKLLPNTDSAVADFEERRWEFIAPTFSRGMIHGSFPDEFVLPFMEDKSLGKGGFGEVYEIVLHPKNQHLEADFQTKLVRKEFQCPEYHDTATENQKVASENHRLELENLGILSHLRHPNIVELLASYTHNDQHNLIFPLAEGGSLDVLFKQERPTAALKSNISFLVSIADLASAIEHVHDFAENRLDLQLMGCHYDLRPENILVSEDRLILADFGLSRFKETTEDSATTFKKGGGNYRAPECEDLDRPFQKHAIHRSSDIWSFGCVLAELITYMIRGSVGVAEFKASRFFREGKGQFFFFHHGPRKPSTGVTEWVSQLSSTCSRTNKMLLELVQRMLSMEAEARPRAKKVTASLRLIALCEMSQMVNRLLDDYISKHTSSLDAIIERTRLESWQYALGILEGQVPEDMAVEASKWHRSDFKLASNSLESMQAVFKSLSSLSPSEAPFYRLTELNDRLDDVLIGNLKDRARSYFKVHILETKDVSALPNIQDSIKLPSLPAEIRMRVALKYMNELAMLHRERDTSKRHIDEQSIKILPGYKEHLTARLIEDGFERPILVEWRDFGKKPADKTVQDELLVRADAISDMLGYGTPQEFCTLDCRGFFLNSTRSAFGLVFDFPQTESLDQTAVEPRSLHKILEDTAGQTKLYPTLDDRFWIAHKLCRSVLEFHMVGWLHKSLSSFNVLFFPTSRLIEDDWFRRPYVVGFTHSRPDEVSTFTSGPDNVKTNHYQHPTYFVNRRYCAEYEYYSLGVVLLEIGIWAPLSSMIKNYEHCSFKQIRQHLIERRLPLLKQSMGRHYYEAVKSCLQGGLDGSESGGEPESADDKSSHLHFDEKVVTKLAKLVQGS